MATTALGSLSECRLLARNPLQRQGRFRARASDPLMTGGGWIADAGDAPKVGCEANQPGLSTVRSRRGIARHASSRLIGCNDLKSFLRQERSLFPTEPKLWRWMIYNEHGRVVIHWTVQFRANFEIRAFSSASRLIEESWGRVANPLPERGPNARKVFPFRPARCFSDPVPSGPRH